jgi:hypothetical protein
MLGNKQSSYDIFLDQTAVVAIRDKAAGPVFSGSGSTLAWERDDPRIAWRTRRPVIDRYRIESVHGRFCAQPVRGHFLHGAA